MNARVIEHQQAIKDMMAERYLLGELTGSDREAYEAHLFDCAACFEQVKAGTEFVNYLKKAGAELPAEASGWRQLAQRIFAPTPALAFALLFLIAAGLNVYQVTALHRSRVPETEVVSVVTLAPESRGEPRSVMASRNGSFELRVVLQPRNDVHSYQISAMDASGKDVASTSAPAPQNGEMQVRFAARPFQSGKYFLVVQGVNQSSGTPQSSERFPFELSLKD